MRQRRRIGGLQYLVAAGGQTLFEHHAGLSDELRGTPVTPATTFNLYSITKPFTAASTLVAAQSGAVDLDAPLAEVTGLASLRSFGTVRQTLLHRGGFPNPMPLRWFHLDEEDVDFDEAAFVTHRLQALQDWRARPGRAAYSNLGYLALGRAVERAWALPFRRAVQRSLLDRLTLLERGVLGFAVAEPSAHARGQIRRAGLLALALGWLVDRDRIVEGTIGAVLQLRLHHVDGSAYGGLIGNARGLAALGQAAIGQVPGLPARDAMLSPVPGDGPERTLAFFTGQLKGQRWFGHAGGGLGGYGEVRLYPALEAVSVLLTNAPGLRDHRWLDDVDPLWIEGVQSKVQV